MANVESSNSKKKQAQKAENRIEGLMQKYAGKKPAKKVMIPWDERTNRLRQKRLLDRSKRRARGYKSGLPKEISQLRS